MRGVLMGLSLFVVACGASGVPSSPTTHSDASQAPVVPKPTGPAAALEITRFALGAPVVHDGWYTYSPELGLKETTGIGGAEVTAVVYTEPNGNRTLVGTTCLNAPAVQAGGTWSSTSVYLYCRDVDSQSPIGSLAVEVHYVDTAGNAKTVSGSAR